MILGKKNNVSEETIKNEQKIMATTPIPSNNMNDVNRIALGTKLVGDMASENDIRIDGDFEGRLYCAGRLVVGEKAVLKGDFYCANIDFSGTMKGGNIYAKETLSLKSGCTIEGNLFFQRFQVELDSRFTGACKVIGEAEFSKVSAPVSAMLK